MTTEPDARPPASATQPFDAARLAGDVVIAELGRPDVAVVLGSGWSAHLDALGRRIASIPLTDIPGVPAPTVVGHGGEALMLDCDGRRVLALSGRSHLYEGHSPADVVHTVRAAVFAGCRGVVLTNAAGSLDVSHRVGQPVIIRDQLNLTGTNPMCGPPPPPNLPGRFVDLTDLYSVAWRQRAGATLGGLAEGVYAGMLGGSYETPAEIVMLGRLGADLVGMSTVLEAIAAHHLGADVAGVSLVTNAAAGLGGALSHDEVLEAGSAARGAVLDVLRAFITTVGDTPTEVHR